MNQINYLVSGRTDEPCLVDSLSGSVLTYVSQHKLTLPQEVIAVGDYNSSLRLLRIPSTLTTALPNEITVIKDFE